MGMCEFVFLLSAISSVARVGAPPSEQSWLVEKRADEQSISLIRLIASPLEFDGKYVVVQGYLLIRDEHENSIFVDENSFRNGLSANSIAVDFGGGSPDAKARAMSRSKKYVIIAGRFKSGASTFSGGVIKEVYVVWDTAKPGLGSDP